MITESFVISKGSAWLLGPPGLPPPGISARDTVRQPRIGLQPLLPEDLVGEVSALAVSHAIEDVALLDVIDRSGGWPLGMGGSAPALLARRLFSTRA